MGSNHPNNWYYFRKKWLKNHPPDEDGNYTCWICEQPVHESVVTLDHVLPVELYPEYAKEPSNIRPAHQHCNQQRGQPKHAQLIHRFGSHKTRFRGYRSRK